MTLPDTVTVDSFRALDTVQQDTLRDEAFRHSVNFETIYRIERGGQLLAYFIYLRRDGHAYLVDGELATYVIRVPI